MKSLIELIYSLLIGVVVAVFAGTAIWAVYPGPKMPDSPDYNFSNEGPSEEDQKKMDDYNKQWDTYQNDSNSYGQRVAIIATISAMIIFAAGYLRVTKNAVMREGLAFGGLATSLYALMRAATGTSSNSTSSRLTVVAPVTLLLIMALLLVHSKFGETKSRSK